MENDTPTQDVPAAKDTNPYIVDQKIRSVQVEYAQQKFILEHGFVAPDNRELVQFYLKAPSFSVIKKGERSALGQASEPLADLHDQTADSLRRLSLTGDEQKTYSHDQIREMRQSVKSDGMIAYIGGYYDVELSVDSGDMDDLLFDKAVELTATVKVRSGANGKVDQTFKIFLSRPDDLTLERFTKQSSTTSIVDENDPTLIDLLGQENLDEMTGGEDEGERVAFSKNTQLVRYHIDIVDKNLTGAENVLFKGQPFNPQSRNEFVQALDPMLKLQLGAALRNFM